MGKEIRKFNSMFATEGGLTFAPGDQVEVTGRDWGGVTVDILCNGHTETVKKADFWNATERAR